MRGRVWEVNHEKSYPSGGEENVQLARKRKRGRG